MKIIINGRNIELTEAIKDSVHDKFSKLESHYDFIKEIHVFLSVEKNPRIQDSQKAEATVLVKGATFRVAASCEQLYGSLDKLLDKIERSLRKYKTKLLQRSKSGHSSEGESIRHIADLEHELKRLNADSHDDEASETDYDEQRVDSNGLWIVGELYEQEEAESIAGKPA